MNFSLKKWLLLATLCCVLLLVFYYTKQVKPIPVVLHKVSTGVVKKTVSNTRVGTVKACRRAYLAPSSGGEVITLNVREGAVVKQQQVLLEVWNQGLKAQVELNQAEIHRARAIAEQTCLIAAGSERVAKRLIQLKKHQHIVAEEAVDLAKTKARAEQAACRAAKQRIMVNQARLRVAQAAVERTFIRAPFDGTVAEVNAELGEFITPSPPGIQTLPAVDLIDAQCLYISAPIDEVDAPLVATGMQACVTLDAFAEQRCSGVVIRIAPYVLEKEKQARTVEVEVKLTDPKQQLHLLPGYSADIEVLIEQKRDTLRIPSEALLEGNRVLVRDSEGILAARGIDIGLKNWHFTEVIAGLQAGEDIVLSIGREGVQAGAYTVTEP